MPGQDREPNFVIIYCDDLGYGDLGCFGSEYIKTPHLDALACEGIRFTNWYSNSPVCSPSRASLLTGRYPRNAGVSHILGGSRDTPGLLPSEITIATALRGAGYRTAIFGKWHLGVTPECRPNAHGFDEFFGFLAGCVDYYSHIFYWGQGNGINPIHDLWYNGEEVWENGNYLTELITERSVEFINGHADEPFFLYIAYNAPHYPMHAPQKYLDRYPDLEWDKRIMAAMISAVDDGVGEITNALRSNGLHEHTIIFFSSDNGPSTESRNWLDGTQDHYYGGSAGGFLGAKGSLFEGGIREPAIIAWPGHFPAGVTRDQPCAMMDILPTFLELAGSSMPDGREIDGRSVVPVIHANTPGPHKRIFWEYNKQLAVREGKWKLVLNGKLDFSRSHPDEIHLADLNSDQGECLNLAGAHPEVVSELAAAVREWYSRLRV